MITLAPELADANPGLEHILSNLDLIDASWRQIVRDDFAYFRQHIRPGMLWGFWNEVVAIELTEFYKDFVAGKRPKIVICTPPQHGKSWTAVDFIGWVSGRDPNLKTIFASFSDELGMRTNKELQRMLDNDRYRMLFPKTKLAKRGETWQRNASILEFAGHSGSFRNVTVEGAINGMELHLGVIDDPHKGRNEAISKTNRDRVWNWFTDDWMARFAENSALMVIATRWHIDDLVGRYQQHEPNIKIVSYPAIAEKDEFWHNATKPLRCSGQPLFKELKGLDFLLERKKLMTESSWQSEYQQNPITVGGGVLPIENLKIMPYWNPVGSTEIRASIRYWDRAGTEGGGNYSAGVLMHALNDGRYVISHIERGQWSAYVREKNIRRWAEDDARVYANYEVGIEQEPGSSGKDVAEATVRNLAGFSVFVDKVTGSKETRANPFAAMVQNSGVLLIAGSWVQEFVREAEAFPNGKYDDQIDGCSGAFNRLAQRLKFDSSFRWVDG
jgi:predicted phage terminase large subunit-like protein